MREAEAFALQLAGRFKGFVADVFNPLAARVAAIEAAPAGKDGRDGRDIDPVLLAHLVQAAVQKEMAERPVPVDGMDGRDGADADPAALADMVEAAVARCPAPVNGKDGADADMGAILARVDKAVEVAVAALSLPKDGRDGRDGVDVDPAVVRTEVANALAEMSMPRDGRDGVDGKDGLNGVHGKDVDPAYVRTEVEKAIAAFPKPQDGRDGRDGQPGRDGVGIDGKNGADGLHGKDGADGLGFDDLTVEHDGGRAIAIKFQRGDQGKAFDMVLPVVLDSGVYREQTDYQRGDGVTFGGSFWIAQKSTSTKPDSGDGTWRLAVKKGRDGKDGTIAPRVEPGPVKLQ